MKEALQNIRQSADALIAQAADAAAVDELRVRFLGKKGELTAVLKQMGKLSAEERPVMGQLANAVRADLEAAIEAASQKLEAKALEERLGAPLWIAPEPDLCGALGAALFALDSLDSTART